MAHGKTGEWGVTQVTIKYVTADATWEVALDPAKIDILVFNQERFEKINAIIGRPLPEQNHIQPDGRPFKGPGTPQEIAKRMGLSGPPRRIGPREAGTSHDPLCVHNQDCTWWCISDHME
jgi:hypothetical protein